MGGRKEGGTEGGRGTDGTWLSLRTAAPGPGLAEAAGPCVGACACGRGRRPWAETFACQADDALCSPPAQGSLPLLKMSTPYLARIFPDLENSIKQLSNT